MTRADFIKLVGPSGYTPNGVLASVPASGLMYVRCPAGPAVEKIDWLLQGNRNHAYQFFRCPEIPSLLSTLTIAGWLNAETLFLMGNTYTGATATTTWSTRGISIAGADDIDAGLLQKAINGGTLLTLASVVAAQYVTIDGVRFTAHASTTTVANREFRMNQTDTLDAAELVTCINDATYGVSGVVATLGAATGEILLQHTASYDTRPVASASAGTIVVSTVGETYICADRSTNVLSLRWRDSLVSRIAGLSPFFYTGKTGTATTHAAFTDELLKSLHSDADQVTGKTDNSTSGGRTYTQTINGADEGFLAVTNSDGSNPLIARVGAYRIPW